MRSASARSRQFLFSRSPKPNRKRPQSDRKSTRLNSSHVSISYAVFCLKKKKRHVYLLDRLAAGASLGYLTTDRSRILSEIHFYFPFVVIRKKSLFVLGRLQTSTFKTGS